MLGIGSVRLKLADGAIRVLEGVRYVPDLKRNLISLGMLDAQGYVYKAEGGVLKVTKGSMVMMRGELVNGLYKLKGSTLEGTSNNVTEIEISSGSLWHKRLGHVSERGLKEMSKQKLLGDDVVKSLDFCELCILGKARKLKFNTVVHCTKGILDYIHSDLWGPARVQSHKGAKYFMTLIDDYSRKVWVYILKHKSEAFNKFKDWCALVENQTDRKVRKLITGNGLEFFSK